MSTPAPMSIGELYEDDGISQAYREAGYARIRFTLRDDGDRLTLRGQAPSGTLQGAHRNIRLRIALERPPAAVTLNGAPLDPATGHFNQPTRRYTLHLPRMKAEAAWVIEIRR